MEFLNRGQFCRAVIPAASDSAIVSSGQWPTTALGQPAEMCFHNGDNAEGDRLLELVATMRAALIMQQEEAFLYA